MEDISEVLRSLEAQAAQLDHFHDARDQLQLNQVSKSIKDQVDRIENFDQLSKPVKARLTYFKGKALAMTENYEKQAEDLLTRSIRLDPKNFEAWATLGEVFYAKKDYAQARRCFEGSLEQSGPRKDALRKLSIVFRFLEGPEEKKDCVVKSIELAKQALALDLTDGESWYILGNAHLTSFFTNSTKFEEIEKALKSYSQGLKHLTYPNPDLHFNRALALNAAESYREALDELRIADSLDPGLQGNVKENEILENLRNIFEMIQKKCNVKKRTVAGLCKSIPSQLKNMQNVQLVPVSELQPGKNLKKMLSMKVLGYSNLQFPPIFVACDFKGDFFALSVYSFPKQSKLALGCSVFVNEPVLVRVEVPGIEYWSVQVRDPNDLMIQNN